MTPAGPEVEEERLEFVLKPKVEVKTIVPGEQPEVTEAEVKPQVIERPKPVPLEESPRPPSPEFFDAMDTQPAPAAEVEEGPEAEEEVLEQAVKPKKVDRPLPKPIVDEKRPREESPLYEEIPEQEQPIYEEIPERPADEEVTEQTMKQKTIQRPKPKPIVTEEKPVEPDFTEEIKPVEKQPEETGPSVEEETVVPDRIAKKVYITYFDTFIVCYYPCDTKLSVYYFASLSHGINRKVCIR